jgi:hypothetical protein
MKGMSLHEATGCWRKAWEKWNAVIEQIHRVMRYVNLRRRRTGNLPIRGISREWAKALFLRALCGSVVNQIF